MSSYIFSFKIKKVNSTFRHYLKYYSTIVLGGGLLTACLNYYVDPAHLFSTKKYEKGIADILLSGKNVSNVSNYDNRIVQKYYINQLQKPKEVLVFGSSRSMNLNTHLFPGKSFFNHSVAASSFEDYLAIYELYYQCGFTPSKVVLELSPWLLNQSNLLFHWMSLRSDYFTMATRLEIDPYLHKVIKVKSTVGARKILQLISIAYLRESVKIFFANEENGGNYFSTEETDVEDAIIFTDGSRLMNNRVWRTKSVAEVEALALLRGKWAASEGHNFMEHNKKAIQLLEAFVTFLQNEGVEVIFYLPPYHPTMYKIVSEANTVRSKAFLSTEAYYRKFANTKEIIIIGGYDPKSSSCTDEDFYDAIHPKASCMNKAFATYSY